MGRFSTPFNLHTSKLTGEGCPEDPTSPVPPPWEQSGDPGAGPSGGGEAGRVSEVGAMLAKWARNPELRPYQQLFRVEPDEAWFDVVRDPDHPTQFEIATARPETGQSILLMDYSVVPYGFSNVTPLDFSPLPDDMISGVFGYSIRINGQEPGILKYQLQAVSGIIRQQAFRYNDRNLRSAADLTADDFTIAQANSYAAAAGFGTGLHPQNAHHYGARGVPFTEWVHDDQVLVITGVIFHQVDIPLAFVQAVLTGFKGPSALIKEIERSLRSGLR